MGAQCAKPNQTTSAEFHKTPSIPAFLINQDDDDLDIDEGLSQAVQKTAAALLPQGCESNTDDPDGEDTPAPFTPYTSGAEDLEEQPQDATPRVVASGYFPPPVEPKQDVRQMLQDQIATRGLAVQPNELSLQQVLCTTCKSTIGAAELCGQLVVVKRIKRDLIHQQDEQSKLAFSVSMREMLQEMQILLAIEHPCVVKLLGANLDSEQEPMLVTECMAGGDVENYMFMHRQASPSHRFKPSVALAMRWSISVAEALAYLHGFQMPIIHRDLKPLNLLLSKDLQVKITDFGISKVMPPTGDKQPAPVMTGGVGTWRYMAPEVVRQEQYTDRVDIFSFSLIVYFIFTGRTPFHAFCGAHPEKILKAYLAGHEPRPELEEDPASPTMKLLKPFLEDAWHPCAALRPSAAQCLARLQGIKSQGVLHSVQSRVKSMWKRAVTQ